MTGWILGWFLFAFTTSGAETFRVATYNLENYLDTATESRPNPKTSASRARIRETILQMKPDVVALQEIGRISALMELRDSLKRDGIEFPHWEHVSGFDTNIFVAVLSRFPIVARRPHTNETFLLSGRRFHVSRGFAEVDIRVNASYTFTLITAHLKSKRNVGFADEAEQRLEEARILRRIIEKKMTANPNANLVVLGDMNDTRNSPPLRTILGRGRSRLVDTRPSEWIEGNEPSQEQRAVTWTHHYGIEDTYSRIDYLLLNPAMAKEWVKAKSYIPRINDWGTASDHRPVLATFEAADAR